MSSYFKQSLALLEKKSMYAYCSVYVDQRTLHFRTFGFKRAVFAFQITYLQPISKVFIEFLLLQHWCQPNVLKQPEVQLTRMVVSLFLSVITVFKVEIYDWGCFFRKRIRGDQGYCLLIMKHSGIVFDVIYFSYLWEFINLCSIHM